MTVFVGLDLAWSARNGTGAVILEPGTAGILRPRDSASLGSDDEILAYVEAHAPRGADAVVAIDAPILAPNPPGTGREADRAVSRLYGRFHAGAYPANRERCARPVALAARLRAELGFSLDPWDLARRAAAGAGGDAPALRHAIEVYPHAAMVGLFGLPRILSYKKGRVAHRRRGLGALQRLLAEGLPGLPVPVEPLAHEDPGALRGRALKALEDRLDAVVCAAMAAHYLAAPGDCEVPGSLEEGYIVVPRPGAPPPVSP